MFPFILYHKFILVYCIGKLSKLQFAGDDSTFRTTYSRTVIAVVIVILLRDLVVGTICLPPKCASFIVKSRN